MLADSQRAVNAVACKGIQCRQGSAKAAEGPEKICLGCGQVTGDRHSGLPMKDKGLLLACSA